MNAVDASSFSDGDALSLAVEWVLQTFTGQIATAIAVLAVACAGFAMLRGRLPIRQAFAALMGTFIMLGARAIASALIPTGSQAPSPVPSVAPTPATITATPTPTPPDDNPYAFASTPTVSDRVTDPFAR